MTPEQARAFQSRVAGLRAEQVQAKPRKYNNEPVVFEGMRFASKHELAQWQGLLLREKAGDIRHLQRQVRFPIYAYGVLVQTYTCDFWFWEDGHLIVADAKSAGTRKTRDWPRTKNLMLGCYGIQIREM